MEEEQRAPRSQSGLRIGLTVLAFLVGIFAAAWLGKIVIDLILK